VSYLEIGAVSSPLDQAILDARPRLGVMLAQLENISNGSLKLLSSANPTLAGQTCGGTLCQTVTSPTPWDGSNVIVWPAGDFNDLADAWKTALVFTGAKVAFALDLTNVTKAIAATRTLLGAVDVKMAFRGLKAKTSTNWLLYLLAGAGALGAVLVARKGGKRRKPGRRKTRTRRR